LEAYIVDHFAWPYIFYINIPVGIIATLLTLQFVRSPKYAEKRPASQVDWLGIFLLTAAVGSLQYILEKGQEDDWYSSKLIITLTIVAALGFYCFIWREMTYKYPIVELRVLKNSNLRNGCILIFCAGLWFVWFYIYYSIIHTNNSWVGCHTIRIVTDTKHSHGCFYDAHNWSAYTAGCIPEIPDCSGHGCLFFILPYDVYYHDTTNKCR
jgi:hypothetical protein